MNVVAAAVVLLTGVLAKSCADAAGNNTPSGSDMQPSLDDLDPEDIATE
jgi:hypothetical protein